MIEKKINKHVHAVVVLNSALFNLAPGFFFFYQIYFFASLSDCEVLCLSCYIAPIDLYMFFIKKIIKFIIFPFLIAFIKKTREYSTDFSFKNYKYTVKQRISIKSTEGNVFFFFLKKLLKYLANNCVTN